MKPSEIFLNAVCENDDEKRMELLVQGCKIMTDNMTFPDKFDR